jgi:phthalate 4,5-cis-dihydrodiol dehydrogenase
MIGVGIVGAGFIGAYHARAIAAVDGLELVAANRTDRDALARFCAEHGCRAVGDARELVEDDAVDVVVIATPHHLHTDITLQAIAAGKSVFLEKPMAANLEQCGAIVAAADAAGVVAMVGFTNRFARSYQVARRLLDSGELGRVVRASSTMSKLWMEPNRRPWHLTAATGGGMWLTAGIHCLDRLTHLVGSDVRHVTGRFATSFHAQDADDVGTVLVEYASGAVGTVHSTGYAVGAPNHLTELVCTNGSLRIEYATGVAVGRAERWETVPGSGSADWMTDGFRDQWLAFRAALAGEAPSPIPLAYGYHVMEAAFAALESSRAASTIRIRSSRA